MFKRLFSCIVCLLLLAALPLTALAGPAPERLTMARLEQLRAEGKVDYVLSDAGYVTWLSGDFYDGKVEGEEGVIGAVERLRDVLGLDEDAQFIKGVALQTQNGYTYYTLRQFSGGTSVSYSIIKVIADGEGRAAAVSSSVTPGLGGELETMIEPEEALAVAQAYLEKNHPGDEYTYYPDSITRTILSLINDDGETTVNAAYIVYTSNPNASTETEDRRYLAHYIGSNGSYLYSLPVHSIDDETALAASDAERCFEGRQEATYTGEVTLHDGSTLELSVPVLYDEAAGAYYLADAQRKIAVMDAYAFQFDKKEDIISTPDNTGWTDNDLITYFNYITVYDAFASFGMRSPNGLDMPIAILSDYCDENGVPEDNACYGGIDRGWHTFGSSTLNTYGECVDVMAHEYTHGFSMASLTDIFYSGEPGTINESFSDILGNIIEMRAGRTEDTDWLVGENSGTAVRSMSDPHAFNQPARVGDLYYRPLDALPLAYNDRSGVHVNNSLLAGVAIDLAKAGISLEDQLDLWGHVICAATPLSGFDEMLPMLQFACDATGMPQWKDTIAEAFASRGLTGDAGEVFYSEGCGILQFAAEPTRDYLAIRAYLLDTQTYEPLSTPPYWPDGSSTFSCQNPAGDYIVLVRVLDREGTARGVIYTASGWQLTGDVGISAAVTADISAAIPVTIEAGATVTLEPLTM
ncbi:MAG: M4 family metallopeptidase [Candidatus Fimadaptatus sp.]